MSIDKKPFQLPSVSSKTRSGRNAGIYVQRIVMGIMATLAIACQPISPDSQPTSQTTPTTTEPTPTASILPIDEAPPSAQSNYTNEQFGFTFAYPDDFVLDNSQPASENTPENEPELTLDLWQQDQFAEIQSGAYEGGTEYPPNVQVAVYSNRDRLSLEDWVKQSNRFVLLGELQTQAIAGQPALAFSSDGLYRSENVVLPTTSGDAIVVISGAEIDVAELDEPNRRAFERVISTFAFTN